MENSEFWNQFVGSSSANAITAVVLMVFYSLKKLCTRESKCKSHFHSCCCDIDVRDVTQRRAPQSEDGSKGTLV